MSRPIDADELFLKVDSLCESCDCYRGVKCSACKVDDIISMIDGSPTLEPKRGEWVKNSSLYICSNCGNYADYQVLSNFCGFCGAEMKGESK